MPVELEEIALFSFFKLKDRTILIQEEHLSGIADLAKELAPINIDAQKLQRLGFLRHPNGIYYREQGSVSFFLRPLKNGQWEFTLSGSSKIRLLKYIHQLQRLWFALFDDHLFIPPHTKTAAQKKDPPSGSFQRQH